jgi:hypothetical protein
MYHTREASDHKVTHTSLNGGGLYQPVHVKTFTQPEAAHVAEAPESKVLNQLALLFGIGTGAFPSWGSRTRWKLGIITQAEIHEPFVNHFANQFHGRE